MASSSRLDLVLNLALSKQRSEEVQLDATMWHPNFVSSRGPVIVMDYVMQGNDVAAGVARDLLTPRDLKTLGKKEESIAVDDAMAISIQCASSVANLGQRLLAKNQEVRELTLQLGNLRVALRECHTLIKD